MIIAIRYFANASQASPGRKDMKFAIFNVGEGLSHPRSQEPKNCLTFLEKAPARSSRLFPWAA